MKYVFSLLISLFLSDLTQASCTVLDDKGNKIILVHPAQHVISLAPDLTEILFAIGAKDQIAGVIKGSDYPAAAKQLPIVASYNSVNLEKILMHHADLIIVWGEGQFVQTLKKLSIPIYVSDPKKITDIPNTMQRLGCLTGKEKNAGKAIQEFNEQYQKLEKTYSSQKKLSVFYQVWQQPLITVSKQSWINDVITMCGGKNIFANLTGAAPQINLETVIMANPEVIIGTDIQSDWRAFWRKWSRIKAVKNNNFIVVNSDLIERASPRLLEGAEIVCRRLDGMRNG